MDFDAAAADFHSRYIREDSLGGSSRLVKARRADWKAEDWKDMLFNCQEDGNGHIACTTLGGEDAAQFLIPPGESPYGMWIADELIKCKKPQQEPKQLRLLDPEGSIFCTRKIGDEFVAMKTLTRLDNDGEGVCSMALREMAVLKMLSHKNIVRLLDVFCAPREVVLVFELLEIDLRQYIRQRRHKGTNLSSQSVKTFMQQLTVGIEYVHAKGILHRDLRPSNILIDQDNNLKIGSFGSATHVGLRNRQNTHEVIALWYRPPEILLGSQTYCRSADMWSCGCILGEMASGKPPFAGHAEIDQIFKIFHKLGTPTEAQWPGLHSLPDFKQSFPKWEKCPWAEIRNLSSQLGPDGLALIDALLRYDPMARLTAKAALQLNYLSAS